MRHLLLLALLLPLTASAQTNVPIVNSSFENLQGWTGSYGIWKPVQGIYSTPVPDGSYIGFANNTGTIQQDLQVPAQPSSTYVLKIWVGHRLDGYTAVATYQLLAGTTSLCSMDVDSSTLPAGTFTQKTLTCSTTATPPSGNLNISILSHGTQTDVDEVTLTVQSSVPPPSIVTFTFPVQLTTCTKCDGTDDQGAAALGLFAGSKISISSGTSTVCSGVLNANAQMSCSAGIDISPAMIPLSLTVVSGDGSQSYTDSQQILGILFMGRNVINVVALFDATNLQPRGLRVWSQ